MRAFAPLLTYLFILLFFYTCSKESTPVYQLTTAAEPPQAGSVTQSATGAEQGETITVAATANEHWQFTGWSGDHSGSQNPASIVMDRDKSVTALFASQQYPLTLTIEGEGTVQQEIAQARATDYPIGTTVRLTAQPEQGWAFSEWQGDLQGVENPAEITITGQTDITAVFERREYPLLITIEGEGSVSVELKSGTQTSDGFLYESVVEISAIPQDGWEFVEWSGDVDGTSSTVELVIDNNIAVTARFDLIPAQFSVDLTLSDGLTSIALLFGQSVNAETLRTLAPPAPPAGALNAFFTDGSDRLIHDYRPDNLTNIVPGHYPIALV
jgi:NOL1/NOP2/fmu family ribosome biogenesis protein